MNVFCDFKLFILNKLIQMNKIVLSSSNLDTMVKKIIKEFWDPWKSVTYRISVNVLFEGFDESELNFKLVFENDEDASNNMNERVKERLEKAFNNIVRYEIVKTEKSEDKDRILPMM